MTDPDYYPPWLADALLTDSLPWDQAVSTTLETFLQAYSLHDSCWITFSLDPVYDGGGLAAIRWDTFWTEGRVAYPGDMVAGWPILLIRFKRVHGCRQTGYEIEAPVPTRGIAGAECKSVADSPLMRTVVADHYGGQLELEHAPDVDILCVDRGGQVLSIPSFSAA